MTYLVELVVWNIELNVKTLMHFIAYLTGTLTFSYYIQVLNLISNFNVGYWPFS